MQSNLSSVKGELSKALIEFKKKRKEVPINDEEVAKASLNLIKKIQKYIFEYEQYTFLVEIGSKVHSKEEEDFKAKARDAAIETYREVMRDSWISAKFRQNFRTPRLYAPAPQQKEEEEQEQQEEEEEQPSPPSSPRRPPPPSPYRGLSSASIASPFSFEPISLRCSSKDDDDDNDDDDDDNDIILCPKREKIEDIDSSKEMKRSKYEDELDTSGREGGYEPDDGMDCETSSSLIKSTPSESQVDLDELYKRPNTDLEWEDMVREMEGPNAMKLAKFKGSLVSNNRDWNAELQSRLEQKCETPEDYLERASSIKALFDQFCRAAQELFKKIIVKYYRDPSIAIDKGHAGGVKFKEGNIFFKLCVHKKGDPYENDIEVMKAANLEIQGLSNYMNCDIQELCFPMMATIDWMGFRVIASSILPISNYNDPIYDFSDTIVYGTDNGGTNFFSCKKADALARKTASILGIKKHDVKDASGRIFHLWAAADTEIDYGYDGRLYMLDTARCMPTEPFKGKPFEGARLAYMVRPEMVQRIGPQNPDYALKMGHFRNKEEKDEEAENIRKLFEMERTQAIHELSQAFANRILEYIKESHERGPSFYYDMWKKMDMRNMMHKRGLNMRSLYLFYREAQSNTFHALCVIIATEVIARKVKWELREFMRNYVRTQIENAREPETLWKDNQGFRKAFALEINTRVSAACFQGMSDKENFYVDSDMLLRRLNDMLSLNLSDKVLKTGVVSPDSLKGYISSEAQVKCVDLLPFQEGISLYSRACARFSEVVSKFSIPSVYDVINSLMRSPPGTVPAAPQIISELKPIYTLFEHAAVIMGRGSGNGVVMFRLNSYLIKTLQERAKIMTYLGKLQDAWNLLMEADDKIESLDKTQNMIVDLSYVVSTRRDIYKFLLELSKCSNMRGLAEDVRRKYEGISGEFYKKVSSCSQPIEALKGVYDKLQNVLLKRWFFGEYETRDISSLNLPKKEGKKYFLIRTSPKRPGMFVLTAVVCRKGVFEKRDFNIEINEDKTYTLDNAKFDSFPHIMATMIMNGFEIVTKEMDSWPKEPPVVP